MIVTTLAQFAVLALLGCIFGLAMRAPRSLGDAVAVSAEGAALLTVMLALVFGVLLGQFGKLADELAMLMILLVAVVPCFPSNRQPRQGMRIRGPEIGYALLAVLLVAGLAVPLAMEISLREVFGWDAWSAWMAKAKVWASLGEYVPIVALERWAEDPAAGWPLTAPDYPQLGSLAAGWFSVRLAGGWSPTAAGLAWLWIYLLLLAGLWGRLADFAGYGSAFVGVFLLGSLPLIQTHVALAGYLDFWLCAFYGFAAMALAGAARGQPRSWFFLLAFALCLPLLKREGWVWMLTLLPAAVVARYRFRGMLGVAIVTVALAGAALAIGIEFANVELSAERIAIPGLVDYPLALEEGLRALVKNLLVLESWHVAIWFVPVVLLLMIRQLSHAELQAGLVLLLGGFCFFVLLFLFTPAATWVRSHTITSRIVMQQMAALIFFGWLAVSYWLRSSERYSDRIDPAQSSMEKQGVASI